MSKQYNWEHSTAAQEHVTINWMKETHNRRFLSSMVIAIIFWLNLAEFHFHDTLRDTTKTSDTKEEYVDGSWYTHIVSYLIKHYQRLSQGPHSLSVIYMGVPKMWAKQNVIIVPSSYPSNGIKVCATLSGRLSFVISKRQKVTEGTGEAPHLFKVRISQTIKEFQ